MDVQLAVVALIAGALTILAPCILPVLPVILGVGSDNKKRAYTITVSLMTSIVLTTLLIRATTSTIGLRAENLQPIAGVLLILVGLATLFPQIWDWLSLKLSLANKSNSLHEKAKQRGGTLSDVLLGASLGPVFTSCSPTYAVIVALVLTGEFISGTIYLVLYAVGLGIMLLAIALAGRKLIAKLEWATDPHGWFKRIIALIFIVLGIAILTGFDKTVETWLLQNGVYDPIAEFENSLRK